MPTDIVVPQVGEAVSAVTITRWLKREGDRVVAGEPLFEIDTEKAIVEIEAVASGRLVVILAGEGAEVQPLQVVGRIVADGEEEQPSEPAPARGAPAVQEAPPAQHSTPVAPTTFAPVGSRIRATPRAKLLARDLNVDLAAITPTGPAGMVCVADVERAAAERAAAVAVPLTPGQGQPLSPRRLAIARSMTLSKTTIPHFYLMRDVDMSQAARLREFIAARTGSKPTYTAILVRACALALRDYPALNANWRDDRIYIRPTIDVGVAVVVPPAQGETESGLVVPVLRQADGKSLAQVTKEMEQLVERARSNRLRADDMDPTGRSLTVSNLGMFGTDAFLPIIYPPDPMLLAAGAVTERPWVEGGRLVVRLAATLTLAVDHRLLDGAAAAQYLERVKQVLEYPYDL